MSAKQQSSYSAKGISARIDELGRQISRANRGRPMDVVVSMDRGFLFCGGPVARCRYANGLPFRAGRSPRRAAGDKSTARGFFCSLRPELKRRDVLVPDAVMDTGVTQQYLLRRLAESQPRSLRLAVLQNKTASRRVALEPDYFGFQAASNRV